MNVLLPMFVGVFLAAFALEAKQRNRRGPDLPLMRGLRDFKRGFSEGYGEKRASCRQRSGHDSTDEGRRSA